MRRFLGWPARGRQDRQADLSDLLEPPPDYADEAALLDGPMTIADRRFTPV